ncbi:LysR family transcriptional regulator [Variovorax sp. KBW07]|uniref:LysR substrate-binding domain-containing protein n=1 Tax=Variovorax sp. KBW07 TaxID=2153358 RepID=UPI000F580C50|nr:LysR substrate-binding domain-containing protein [Variovorax sp. KBW07]RQO46797.1 LysR family transcriptional regulator [Variovorax sp. KBW07]
MARQEINRSGEMEVFVQVVDSQSFSAAARRLSLTPSAVSKLVARLEARLGARLLVRSTRGLHLTPEGASFHARARGILDAMAEAEREVSQAATPRGRVRINTNVPFGRRCLLPLMAEFLARCPEIFIDLVLTDQVVNVREEKTDIAIRTGPLKDSGLVSRELGQSRFAVVASPAYLQGREAPAHPADLARHNCLGFGFIRHTQVWPFVDADGARLSVVPRGNMHVSDGETMRELALEGVGLARLARFHVGRDIAEGRLVPLLEPFNPGDTDPVHAVFIGPGKELPARVRAVLDFLYERVVLDE